MNIKDHPIHTSSINRGVLKNSLMKCARYLIDIFFNYRMVGALMIFLSGVLAMNGCSVKKKFAPDRNFYFEIITHGNNEFSQQLEDYLKEQIPKRKYTITNHSGLSWPFYKELDLNEDILQDSLMPPHWYLHRMIPFSKGQIKLNEFLVKIDLLPHPDTLPNYNVTIYKMDSTGLSMSAESGIHYIDSTEFTSENSLFETYLRSIVRYSFK